MVDLFIYRPSMGIPEGCEATKVTSRLRFTSTTMIFTMKWLHYGNTRAVATFKATFKATVKATVKAACL